MTRSLPALLCILPVTAAHAQEARFTFAPPDGTEYRQMLKSTVVTEVGKQRMESIDESVTAVRIARGPDGYRIRATPTSFRTIRNGVIVQNPVAQSMVGHTLTYNVATDGSLQGIDGFEQLFEKMKASLPPDVQGTLGALLDPEMMMNREAAEYSARFEDFAGKKVKVGDVWESVNEFPLPTGTVKFTTLSTFPAIKVEGDRLLVTIRFQYESDSEALKKLMDRAGDVVGEAAGVRSPKTGEVRIAGQGERVVDARTMLIQSERIKRVITAPLQTRDGRTQVQARTETKEYSFDYSKTAP